MNGVLASLDDEDIFR